LRRPLLPGSRDANPEAAAGVFFHGRLGASRLSQGSGLRGETVARHRQTARQSTDAGGDTRRSSWCGENRTDDHQKGLP